MYDFDTIIDRTATNAVKWQIPDSFRSAHRIIPLWVADLDMASPPEVVEALRRRAEHPVYGYTAKSEDLYGAYIAWMRSRYGVSVDRSALIFSPGIVPAIATAIRAYTEVGDGITILPPVYHPFKHLIEDNRRTVVEAPLSCTEGRYEIDFPALEAACSRSKLMIFCSPHNPVGRVWRADELQGVVEIAERYDVTILSDEIHADLVYPPHTVVSMLSMSARHQHRLISCWAPSKTFNIAGLQASFITIPDKALRSAFERESAATGIGSPNCFAVDAVMAAYEHGGPWLDALLPYLRGNYEYLVSRLTTHAPALKVSPCEGTFLAWIDFRGAGLHGDVGPALIERTGLWLDAGVKFGTGGDGFARLNFGCPRSTLVQAVDRLVEAFGL